MNGLLIALLATVSLFNVRDRGAVGDGFKTDTAALQAAIDAAAEAGGGVVRVPAGTYRCGSIFLKSNVTLDLAEGATIAASHDSADYNAWDVCPQNVKSAVENTSGGHLILCIGQTNVTLRGRGTIEGGGRFFLTDGFDRGRVGATGRNDHGGFNPQDAIRWRPSSMIYFVECADVRLEGLRFIDSPYWSVFLHGCERVAVDGITIRTSRKDPYIMNGDGLSLDCCRHVRVTGCDIETSDDALCLRANGKRLLRAPAETSDVRIGNCTLSSTQDAIRIGVGEGRIRDCVLTNLVIRDSRNGINFSSTWFKSHGVDFEDILISNVVSHTKFDFLRIHRLMSADSLVRGITIADVRGEQGSGSMIRARRAKPFRDILLKDIFLDKGVEVIGAENLRIEGGTLKVLPRTKEELDALDADIEAFRNLIH